MIALTIDPEFQALISPLTAEEQAQLEANLLAEGCREPLVVWPGELPVDAAHPCQEPWRYQRPLEGLADKVTWLCPTCGKTRQLPYVLLDGHHRHPICQAQGLGFAIVEAPAWVQTHEDAKIWIIQNQLGRRNLEDYQRGELALRLKGMLEAKAKAQQGTSTDLRPNLDERFPSRDSTAEMAKAAGLSRAAMAKVKVIAQEAGAPTKEALRRGERSIDRVYQELRQPRTTSKGKEGAETASGVTTPAAGRATKKLTGAVWQERLVAVRQHFAQLQRLHLVENLVRTWALDVANGYRAELAHLIEDLRQVLQRIDVAIWEHVDGDPQFLMARRLIELADGIQHELATWRQQFPEDPSVHAFGLMEKHLRELRDYFRMKQRERSEPGAAVEVPTNGDAADSLREESTAEDDEMGQARVADPAPHTPQITTRPHAKKQATRARAKASARKGRREHTHDS